MEVEGDWELFFLFGLIETGFDALGSCQIMDVVFSG